MLDYIDRIDKKFDRMEEVFTDIADGIGNVFGKPPGTIPNGVIALAATIIVTLIGAGIIEIFM